MCIHVFITKVELMTDNGVKKESSGINYKRDKYRQNTENAVSNYDSGHALLYTLIIVCRKVCLKSQCHNHSKE